MDIDKLLDDIQVQKSDSKTYTEAPKGKRLANYLIDRFILMLSLGTIMVFIPILTVGNTLQNYLLGAIFTIVYYSALETSLSGKSLGKYLTKTRAINADGSKMDSNTVLKRSLCRIIPFEAFSFLGDEGWHDSLSKTIVIEDDDWEDISPI